MKSNCLIGSGFLDKAKAQCGSELSFTSIPEFINFKFQMPTATESDVQPILIGNISRFVALFTLRFVQLLSKFKTALSTPFTVDDTESNTKQKGQRQSSSTQSGIFSNYASRTRQRLKQIMTGLVNLSIAQSNISIKKDSTSGEIIFHLPQGRACTCGMSNLGLDLDFPTFISNPISLIKCPISLQLNLSQFQMVTVQNSEKRKIISLPSLSIMVSLNIPDSFLVPIMLIANLDLSTIDVNLGESQFKFILHLFDFLQATTRESNCATSNSKSNFCSQSFEKFEFSDIVSEKNEDFSLKKNLTLTLNGSIRKEID